MNTARAFYRSSKAWYADDRLRGEPEIMFGLYADDGEGCIAEMAVRWYNLGSGLSPKLECFDDSWAVLATFTDLIAELGRHDSRKITEGQFAALLKKLGFKDITKYTNPEARPEICPRCGRPLEPKAVLR
jgi:hypothetical protein